LSPRLRSTLSTLGRALLSLVLLGLLAWLFRSKLGASWRLIRTAGAGPLAFAAFWYVAFIVISSWR
jgi:hypothetical protein